MVTAGGTRPPFPLSTQPWTFKMRPFTEGGLGWRLSLASPHCWGGSTSYPGSSNENIYNSWGSTPSWYPSFTHCVPLQSPCSWETASFPRTSRNPAPKSEPRQGPLSEQSYLKPLTCELDLKGRSHCVSPAHSAQCPAYLRLTPW